MTPDNDVRLLESGTEFFPALCQAMAQAQRHIHLETYIFADDSTGRQVALCLAEAAQRGVTVCVVVDGFGSRHFMACFWPQLRAAGVEVRVFRRELSPWSVRRHRLRRLHRKLVVVDGALAFIGGINIVDDVPSQRADPPRFDYAVAVRGPVVLDVLYSCQRLWWILTLAYAGRHMELPAVSLPSWPPKDGLSQAAGAMQACFLVRDNLRHRRDIEQAYLDAIQHAQREVLIANAYFLPGRRFQQALFQAAARGVRVVLLLQGKVEYLLLHFATRSLYSELLAGGVEIYEYQRSFLHAKVAVVDGHWATVGSSNIDPFSLFLAREANVVVQDQSFASQLRTSLLRAIDSGAEAQACAAWQRPPVLRRLMLRLAYNLVRRLTGLAGVGGRS